MLFLLCILFCSSFAYGMDDYVGFSSKDNAKLLKQRKKENEKNKREYKKRLQKEEKSKAAAYQKQIKAAEAERKKREEQQRKAQSLQKKHITQTLGFSFLKKKDRKHINLTDVNPAESDSDFSDYGIKTKTL